MLTPYYIAEATGRPQALMPGPSCNADIINTSLDASMLSLLRHRNPQIQNEAIQELSGYKPSCHSRYHVLKVQGQGRSLV